MGHVIEQLPLGFQHAGHLFRHMIETAGQLPELIPACCQRAGHTCLGIILEAQHLRLQGFQGHTSTPEQQPTQQ